MITLGTLEKSVGGLWKLCTAGGSGLSEFLEVEPAVQLSHQESHSRLGTSRDLLLPVELIGVLLGPTSVSHFGAVDPDPAHSKTPLYPWPGRDLRRARSISPTDSGKQTRLEILPSSPIN